MDLYTTSLLLGGVGLGVMAVSGMGRHGHSGHGHATHGAHAGHGHTAAHAAHGHTGAHAVHQGFGARDVAAVLTSPRILFSLLIGFGTTGELLRGLLGGPVLFVAAVAGGVAFERLLVAPLWNLAMRFASNPARTLESVVTDDATAVSNFDANGQGLVAIELDGQVVQILGTLQPDDRALGVRVRAGERLRVEDVDAARNRCTVSLR
jgi:hypothetical protein